MTNLPTPADPRRLRVADADRDRAADVLREAAAEGRLTMDELDDRVGRAYAAKTYADLEALTADLPGADTAVPTAPPAVIPAGDTALGKFSVAILSGAKRAGPWVVPPTYTAIAVMGGVELDLRDARFSSHETTIQAFCFMGGVTITVPAGVAVDVAGLGFMGGFDHQSGGPGTPGSPQVRVVGLAMMGGVEVKRAPRDVART